ncbi:MAG: fatty acid cis/trans isomerase [Candidatus Methylumidiphilus sp.]
MRPLLLFSLFLLMAGCATLTGYHLDHRFGAADPARFDQPLSNKTAKLDYARDVKPITDSRCAVCHGCFDAPCQLQMGSYDGITRGGNKTKVYDSLRLFAAEPSRLFIDAHNDAEWRQKGFHPVLNEREADPEANLEASVMAKMLKLKSQHHYTAGQPLPDARFDFSLDRAQQCPSIEEFDPFAEEHPEWGMPYGLPGLSQKDQQTLLDWIEAGAPAAAPKPLAPAYAERVAQWESFLNSRPLKNQLMARYIFEHWFLAHLYFDDLKERVFFDLVRSKTPPGQPIQLIASRRPFDDPGVAKVYYRLRPVQATLVAKTHMPYPLNAARMARLKTWFIDDPYTVGELPSYDPKIAANPFVAFQELPVRARYRLMLDEAQFTVMGFIKGPVCRGQVALNVITDYFWLGFADPDDENTETQEFLAKELQEVRLPTDQTSDASLLNWRQYSLQQTQYLRAKSAFLNQTLAGNNRPTFKLLWRGDGRNPNAALTVFRHFDSATVVQGFIGEQPQTALIMGYPLLERMHYLLVAGFDVYGNTAHQLQARLYMDFLRMEGELAVLTFLPKDGRNAVRDNWYRNAPEDVKAYLNGNKGYFYQDSGLTYTSADPWPEFARQWKAYMQPVLNPRYELSSSTLAKQHLQGIKQLAALTGPAIANLPEASFLTVADDKGAEHHFTLLRNSAHSNIAQMFKEENRRLPAEDTLTVVPGFLGAYPNAFYRVTAAELPQFVEMAGDMQSEADYARLAERFAIRRTDERFWQHSDTLHAAYRKTEPVEAALFDYNRLENR